VLILYWFSKRTIEGWGRTVWLIDCNARIELFAAEEQVRTRRRPDFRKPFGAAILLLLGFMAPSALAVVAPANGITVGIATSMGRLTATEPAELALLGSGLISLSFLIRRFQS